jgi:hypothetical protein
MANINAIGRHLGETLRQTRLTEPVISYDRESDELLVYFSSNALERPGISRRITVDFWARTDRDTGEVLGFQIQRFLSEVVPLYPNMVSFLDLAELNGMTAEDVALWRRDFARAHSEETIHEAIEAVPELAYA